MWQFCIFIFIQIVNGYIQYTYKENTLIMDSIKVNDGLWHYVEARWYPGRMEILLDYGQRQVDDTFILLSVL